MRSVGRGGYVPHGLGKCDSFDMENALLAPGLTLLEPTTPLVSRGLGPNAGQGCTLNRSDLLQQLATLGLAAPR